jgi:phage N-6-adenine-methyltransferase
MSSSKSLTNKRRGAVEQYDPEQGLLSIEVAKAGEKHFARALKNNPDDPLARQQLRDAIAAKFWAQAEYVVWRGGITGGKHGGDRKSDQVTDQKLDLPAADPGKVAAHRWRKRLCVKDVEPPEIDCPKVESIIEAEQRAEIQRCEMEKIVRGTEGTGDNEWFTPTQYIELARKVLGEIDLDPASSDEAQRTVKAKRYFTKADDGLKQEWHGRVWLNPPYAQPYIAEFVSKMCGERKAGRVTAAIMLTHNYTSSAWFQELAGCADAICFPRVRIKFYSGDEIADPTQGQAFFYFGDDVTLFAETFKEVGFVVLPMRLKDVEYKQSDVGDRMLV